MSQHNITPFITRLDTQCAHVNISSAQQSGATVSAYTSTENDTATEHWHETTPAAFTADERGHTTIWNSGLTLNHDIIIAAALRGIGYHVKSLPVADNESLRLGKEFGNRGQCNPTYFTVGNLIKHLQSLEAGGLSRERIIKEHLFVTGGGCGPCRFGMYVTEYRKALRDAGFDGFRVLLFEQQPDMQAVNSESGLDFNSRFYLSVTKAILAGDALNLMGYRLRPYEIEAGATDTAMAQCQQLLIETFEQRHSVLRALWRCRKILAAVKVNWLQAKPKVSVIGEFWAMTTEGEGNYELQRFLESEGAEVSIQPIANWIFYLLWEKIDSIKMRRNLRTQDTSLNGLAGKSAGKQLLIYKIGMIAIKNWFRLYTSIIGLKHHHLPDMDHLAKIAHQHYDTVIKGGEGHMEVGKLIDAVEDRRAHMVLSVKPFGCMPSSGVSDGVQSLITARYPEAIFCPVETSGSGKVNVQSRVQMMLFKAHQRAREEFEQALKKAGLSEHEVASRVKNHSASGYPRHRVACTGANLLSAMK
jgi:predicted nucleotide-binding protein (sugar kinase/HSP70/actin superfamily)